MYNTVRNVVAQKICEIRFPLNKLNLGTVAVENAYDLDLLIKRIRFLYR